MSARCKAPFAHGLLMVLALGPVAAAAQTQPGGAMGDMPGMTMDAPKQAAPAHAKKPHKAGKAARRHAAPSSSARQPMDHGPMPGMDHGQMPGMTDGQMPGMDHGKTPGSDPEKMPGMSDGQMLGMSDGQMPGMDHGQMEGMDHSRMPGMDHTQMPGMDDGPMPASGPQAGAAPDKSMDMGATMKSMQGGKAPPDARDPDAYADGLANGHMPGMDMADTAAYAQVLLDRLEQFHSSRGNGQALDAQAWVGGDIDKLWFKVDGERENSRLGATRTEALWNHAIATYWGLQSGLRHDFGGGPGRTWASFGVQGLSPYWFDIQANAYVGQGGRTALRLEAEYDLMLTQRLVLQPDAKVSVYGRNDRDRETGAGLSDIDAGLRLRYEFSRKVAPYVGVVWNRKFANTARYARDAGDAAQETRIVAGLRLWF